MRQIGCRLQAVGCGSEKNTIRVQDMDRGRAGDSRAEILASAYSLEPRAFIASAIAAPRR